MARFAGSVSRCYARACVCDSIPSSAHQVRSVQGAGAAPETVDDTLPNERAASTVGCRPRATAGSRGTPASQGPDPRHVQPTQVSGRGPAAHWASAARLRIGSNQAGSAGGPSRVRERSRTWTRSFSARFGIRLLQHLAARLRRAARRRPQHRGRPPQLHCRVLAPLTSNGSHAAFDIEGTHLRSRVQGM